MHDQIKDGTIEQLIGAPATMNKCDHSNVNNRILVMDDDSVVRLVVQQLFIKIGYSTDCASTGNNAIEMYHAALNVGNPYMMVLMDLNISGGMGGLETVKIIKALDPSARVILFSGLSNDPITNDYNQYGFDGILKKPFSFEECLNLIEFLKIKRNP